MSAHHLSSRNVALASVSVRGRGFVGEASMMNLGKSSVRKMRERNGLGAG